MIIQQLIILIIIISFAGLGLYVTMVRTYVSDALSFETGLAFAMTEEQRVLLITAREHIPTHLSDCCWSQHIADFILTTS